MLPHGLDETAADGKAQAGAGALPVALSYAMKLSKILSRLSSRRDTRPFIDNLENDGFAKTSRLAA